MNMVQILTRARRQNHRQGVNWEKPPDFSKEQPRSKLRVKAIEV